MRVSKTLSRGKAKAKAPRVSVRAFARTIGVSHTAVQQGIRSGRLLESIGRDERGPFVFDLSLAKREWKAGAAKPPTTGGNGHAAAASTAPVLPTLVEAQIRLADQRTAALELANRIKRGELLEITAVQREQFEIMRMLRERILNVADRLADLGPAVRARLRAELRAALGDLADELSRD